jgi:endonuclease YncB( thermonuclease family)
VEVVFPDLVTTDASKQQHRIRINGIDASEKGQAFGQRSRQNLSRMAFQKDARLECHKTDRYGRKVCKVWVQPSDCPTCGKTLDVGHAQVLAGLAWWYREYAKEQSAEDQGRYESAEDEARMRKWGLWQDKKPVPPWEFRRKRYRAGR